MKNLIYTLLIALIAVGVTAQTRKDNLTLSEDASTIGDENFIHIKNINGELNVIGYDGDEVQITAVRELRVRRGRQDITDEVAQDYKLTAEWHEGDLYIFVDAPGVWVRFRNGRMHYSMDDMDDDLNFSFDIEAKVPNDVLLKASTVNSGRLHVANMTNGVRASHVNGDVLLEEISGPASASSVNGDVEVWFTKSPTSNCDFKTVNGTIEVFSPADFGAVVTFESVHGELYTNFDDVTYLPNRLNREDDDNGRRYRIKNTTPIQIGKGGPDISFEMVNGDAFIKQRES